MAFGGKGRCLIWYFAILRWLAFYISVNFRVRGNLLFSLLCKIEGDRFRNTFREKSDSSNVFLLELIRMEIFTNLNLHCAFCIFTTRWILNSIVIDTKHLTPDFWHRMTETLWLLTHNYRIQLMLAIASLAYD